MTVSQYGELHDSWLKAVPIQTCSQCGHPMKIEDLTDHYCSTCKRWYVTQLHCRNCGTEMDGNGGCDRDTQADVWGFTCSNCGAEAVTCLYEEVGHIVIDEEPPKRSVEAAS